MCHLLGDPQAIEPRHQRVRERGRDPSEPLGTRLHRGLRKLLDEEGHAVGASNHGVDHLRRECRRRRHVRHHLPHMPAREAIQGELGVMGPQCPRCLELQPRRVEKEQRRRRRLLDEEPLELEGRGVYPLQVFEQDYH